MSQNYKEVFPKRLKARRTALGVSQDDLANAMGMSRANIANYETGRNFPFTESLIELADKLHTTVDYLVGNANDPEPLKDRSRSAISIESLEDLPLSYNGHELSPEQRKHVVQLLRSALGFQDRP